MAKSMQGKLINIDLWLTRDGDGWYGLFEHPPSWSDDIKTWIETRGESISFNELNATYRRIFSGLKSGECARVRMQRME